MTEQGPPGMWDVPRPGSGWSAPGSAPPPGFPSAPPTAPPTGPPLGPQVGARPEKQLRARPLQLMAALACGGLLVAGIGALLTAASVGDRADIAAEADFEVIDFDAVARERDFFDAAIAADEAVVDDAIVYLLGMLLAGVPWVIWQRRFVRNAEPVGGVSRGIGWGTWGWFVPFAFLYLPEAQLAEAARATDPMRVRKVGMGAASPVVYLWWGAYAGSGILSIGGNWTQPDVVDVVRGTARLSDFRRADQIFQMGLVGQAIAAALAIATVLVCTSRQRRFFHALGVRA